MVEHTSRLLKREEVPYEKTWDLTLIYQNDQEFEAALQRVKAYVPELAALQGTLGKSANDLLHYVERSLAGSLELETAYVYAHMKTDQDTGNSTYQTYYQQAIATYTEFSAATAWFEPELLGISDEQLEAFYKENEALELYRTYFDTLRVSKDHVLPAEQEGLLASAEEVLSASSQTFSLLSNADLRFGTVVNDAGEEVELTHGNYGTLLESKKQEVRKNVFETKYKQYMQLKNTFASTLGNNTKVDNFHATVHGYRSARQAALSKNQIPEDVYDTLVSVVNEKLPLLHRYFKLQKQVLGLEEMHMYDMYVPLVEGDAPFSFTYEEAVEATYEALAPLGEGYRNILQQAFENRWIDVVENEGKRSGAYSSGGYATAPYILLNWQGNLSNFYTLVHELGHSAHSYLTNHTQPYVYAGYPIFLAEIASTTNENLLTHYLLNKFTDKESQIYILNSYLARVKSTIFRQTQFAEFEHWAHVAAQEGTPLTESVLSKKYAEINARYYGEDVIQDEQIAYEWARIPHFYYNYYVYQYATGMAAATALSKGILEKGQPALDAYLTYLSSGRSDEPIAIMKKAGVDMTHAQYLYDALDEFEERLSQLEALLQEK